MFDAIASALVGRRCNIMRVSVAAEALEALQAGWWLRRLTRLCGDGEERSRTSQKDNKTLSPEIYRRNVPSSGEFYCQRGTQPRAGARDWGAGPGQRRPGQRSETQHSALTQGDPGADTRPGNGLDRSVFH